jgi:adenosine deaminase
MGTLDRLSDHPIGRYYRDNVPLSINTDDPRIFGFDLIDNHVALMKECGLSLADLEAINRRAVNSAFV